MAVEMLTYRQLGDRLGFSRDAARELVKRLRLPRHKANDGKVLIYVDLSEINHNLVPTESAAGQLPVSGSFKERIEPNLETSATSHQADLERERERAERLMAELLRAKADILAARATAARLENELAALRSPLWWWHWLRRRKKRQSGNFVVQQTDTNVQAIFASSAAAFH
jgi:hypothetical protein